MIGMGAGGGGSPGTWILGELRGRGLLGRRRLLVRELLVRELLIRDLIDTAYCVV